MCKNCVKYLVAQNSYLLLYVETCNEIWVRNYNLIVTNQYQSLIWQLTSLHLIQMIKKILRKIWEMNLFLMSKFSSHSSLLFF